MNVYITKYALTTGIEQRDCELSSDDRTMVWVKGGYNFYRRGEWHESLDSAQRKAEQMRQKKIAALEKQIARLRAMRFDVQAEKDKP